jgi:hypothetical protein
MPRRLPQNPVEWIEEIRDAMLDACDTEPFGYSPICLGAWRGDFVCGISLSNQ